MSDRMDEFGPDVSVALITFTEQGLLSDYVERRRLGFPALRDVHRSTYRAYGLERGSLGRVWGWRAIRRYVEILTERGVRDLHRPTEDTRQLGGDFVVSPDGILHFGFWGQGPDDRPEVEQLIRSVAEFSGRAKPTGDRSE